MDEFFQWQNDFKIGNFKADVQHKTLFNLAHRINDIALQKKKNRSISRESISELQDIVKKFIILAKEHFETEEEFMQDINYPLYKQHVQSHKILKEKLKTVVKNINNIDLFVEEFLNMTNDWIVSHFAVEDKLLDSYSNIALFTKESSLSLDSYIQIKSIHNRDLHNELKVDYICLCNLKKHEIPISIHEELFKNKTKFRCSSCKQFLVHLDEIYISNFKNIYNQFANNSKV